jgi:molybdopterin-containing oxidoreductase family membrane subunit
MTSDRESKMLRVLTHTSRQFYACFALLCAVALWGVYGYIRQLRYGLIVTGLRDQISWGLYISNFVFFTGISYGGTLISAILRVTNSAWRHPITRLSEAITVFALSIGGPMVIIDMGRPERMTYLFTHGRLQSVILWDVFAVSTYLAGCALYLYLPMIPDLALLSTHTGLAPWRRKLYRKLTFGWTGTAEEQHLLERCIAGMAVFMIVLAVSVHTVVSWIFGMTLRPGWNSSIFGPYFVMGAVYSGTAAVVLSMYILVHVLHLEDYIKPLHFRKLGMLLVTFALLYLYFNINEYLTSGYKIEGPDKHLMQQLFFGDYAVLMWATQAVLLFIPLIAITAVLCLKRLEKYTPITIALTSVLIIIGAGAKRYLIVVPTLSNPFLPNTNLPFEWMHYHPTWVEWSITFGGVAVLLLMYMLFTKVFPMVSIWETREDEVLVESAAAPASTPASQKWGSISGITMVLAACLLVAGSTARAEQKPPAKPPEPTTLTLEYQQVAAPAPKAPDANLMQSGGRPISILDRFFGRLLGWSPTESSDRGEAGPAMQVTATLRDSKGQSLGYQVISLSLKTSFGTLDFGSRPTDEQGKAQFLIKDKRYGQYPVEAVYDGGADFAAAKAAASVNFGARPAPSLPSEGVLIGPNSAAVIAIPFLSFFGFAWFVFLFVGVYVLFWRLPQIRNRRSKRSSLSQIKQRSHFPAASSLHGRKTAAGSAYRVISPHGRS